MINIHDNYRNGKELYGYDPEYIKSINRAQNLWTAGHYEEYEHMTLDEMVLRAGGPMSRIHGFVCIYSYYKPIVK